MAFHFLLVCHPTSGQERPVLLGVPGGSGAEGVAQGLFQGSRLKSGEGEGAVLLDLFKSWGPHRAGLGGPFLCFHLLHLLDHLSPRGSCSLLAFSFLFIPRGSASLGPRPLPAYLLQVPRRTLGAPPETRPSLSFPGSLPSTAALPGLCPCSSSLEWAWLASLCLLVHLSRQGSSTLGASRRSLKEFLKATYNTQVFSHHPNRFIKQK